MIGHMVKNLKENIMSKYSKLLIIDLDGVLIDSRELHYTALNIALKEVANIVIDRDVHLSRYDGLSTTEKLKLLTKEYGLKPSLYDLVWKMKQECTKDLIACSIKRDNKLINFLKVLRKKDIKLACCSNSISETVTQSLYSLGVSKLFDIRVSNEDVNNHKPHPEIYWNAMSGVGTLAEKTIILEDSHIGRQGALRSGGLLYEIEDTQCIRNIRVQNEIINMFDEMNVKEVNIPWISSELNIVIPMAGDGKRFKEKGYSFPKPLIDINGIPMIEAVVKNINIKANYIFIVKKEHTELYNLKETLRLITNSKVTIIEQDEPLQGAASTILLAKKHINNDAPILIANSDQIIEWNSNECMYAFKHADIDGGILTFKNTHPKWSYAELGDKGLVIQVAEKKPLPGNNATVGIYYWKKGSDFVKYAEQMIQKNIKVNGEFYVCPVYNEAIADGQKIRVKSVNKMWGIGTPEDLEEYLRHG